MPLKAARVVKLPSPDRTVNVLKLVSGTELEVGGWFDEVDGRPSPRMVCWRDGKFVPYSTMQPHLQVGRERHELPVVEDILSAPLRRKDSLLLYATWWGLIVNRQGFWEPVAGLVRDTRSACYLNKTLFIGTRDDTQRCCGRVMRYVPGKGEEPERFEQVGADFPFVRSSFIEATTPVRALVGIKRGKQHRLIAGNAAGVFVYELGSADAQWTKLGGETLPAGAEETKPEHVRSLAVVGETIYAAGHYGVKSWHGNGWKQLPFTHSTGVLKLSSRVRYLRFEGTNYLFAVFMPNQGSFSAVCVLRGDAWEELVLVKGQVNDLCIYDDALFLGGDFTEVGDVECLNFCRVELEWTR